MNIGIDIRALMQPCPTGVGEYTQELLSAVFSRNSRHEFFLFYNSLEDGTRFLPPWQGERLHFVGTRFPNKILNASLATCRLPSLDRLVAARAGLPHLDYWFSPNLNFTVLSRATKHILTIHDLSFEHLPDCFSKKRQWWHRAVRPRLQCERAHRIVTPSEYTRQDVISTYGIRPEKVSVLSPGLSALFRAPSTSMDKEQAAHLLPKKYILFLGTLEPRKNILAILDAYVASNVFPYLSLVVAGAPGWKDGPIRARLAATPGVRYIGYVPNEAKPALYAGAAMFVYPSLYEGFGLPPLEAMASGTPVVVSNRTSLPEVVGDAGIMVDPYNTAEITAAMKRLVEDPALSSRLYTLGRERATAFAWQKSADQFLALVDANPIS